MSARRACAGVIPVVALVLGAGCSQAPSRSVAGVVVPEASEIHVGSTVPDIEFRDASGDLHRLSSVYEDATLIVFVEEVCGKPTRELLEAEETLRGRGALVRIYTGSCPSEAECLHVPVDVFSWSEQGDRPPG